MQSEVALQQGYWSIQILTLGLLLQGRWEQKGVYVFYLELLTDMLHLVVYLAFFVIVFTNFGLPVHLVRPAARQRQRLAVLQLVCVEWSMDLLQETCLAASVLILISTEVGLASGLFTH